MSGAEVVSGAEAAEVVEVVEVVEMVDAAARERGRRVDAGDTGEETELGGTCDDDASSRPVVTALVVVAPLVVGTVVATGASVVAVVLGRDDEGRGVLEGEDALCRPWVRGEALGPVGCPGGGLSG
ncbi:MAG: hypothetical protein ACRDYY_11030 [Acidimicrobiales bacterium]